MQNKINWKNSIGKREKILWEGVPDFTRGPKLPKNKELRVYRLFLYVGIFVFLVLNIIGVSLLLFVSTDSQEDFWGKLVFVFILIGVGTILGVIFTIIGWRGAKKSKKRQNYLGYALTEKRLLISREAKLLSIPLKSDLSLLMQRDDSDFGSITFENTGSPEEFSSIIVNGQPVRNAIGFFNIENVSYVYDQIELATAQRDGVMRPQKDDQHHAKLDEFNDASNQ